MDWGVPFFFAWELPNSDLIKSCNFPHKALLNRESLCVHALLELRLRTNSVLFFHIQPACSQGQWAHGYPHMVSFGDGRCWRVHRDAISDSFLTLCIMYANLSSLSVAAWTGTWRALALLHLLPEPPPPFLATLPLICPRYLPVSLHYRQKS